MVALVAAVAVVASSCVMNGTWAAMPAPVVPAPGVGTRMHDVSCTSANWCMAVGGYGQLPLVETWNGTAWSVRPAPPVSPPSATFVSAELRTVDCGTTSACVARIDRVSAGAEVVPHLVLWDGAQWHEVPPGGPVDGPFDDPAPRSCAPDGTCLIVNQTAGRIITWDGDSFTNVPFGTSPIGAVEVAGVECFAADDCLALTKERLLRWNGSSFAAVPGSAVDTVALPGSSFSCTSSTRCVAYGTDSLFVGLHWNGTAWSSVRMPVPGYPFFGDLSCGATECVGIAQDLSLVRRMVTWNGAGWYAGPALPAGVERLSCVGLRCVAVGAGGAPEVPIATRYTWTNP